MIDHSKPILIVMDIDGTQKREDISPDQYSAQDKAEIAELKKTLEKLSEQPGIILMHATNRMRKFYEIDHGIDLALPDYVSCSASTELLKVDRKTGTISRDRTYQRQIDTTTFDAELAVRQGLRYGPGLFLTHADNQSDRKVSFIFDPIVPVSERIRIFEELKTLQKSGTSVYMVEDPDTHIIDFLPSICHKSAPIECVAAIEGTPPCNIFIIGNSNNDIPMCNQSFNCAAVGNARSSLKEHILKLQELTNNKEQYVIVPEENACGVMAALSHFGLTGPRL